MDGAASTEIPGVRATATAYCEALHRGDAAALGVIFHEASHLYAVERGTVIDWPREQFLARVAARGPGEGPSDFAIHTIEMSGPAMAVVHLEVRVGERRFADFLNFLKVGKEWRVISKIFRVADGPAITERQESPEGRHA